MQRIFIDGGANDGKAMLATMRRVFCRPFDRIVAFEPNPRFAASYSGLPVTLVPAAIWTERVRMPLYMSRDPQQCGSSLLKNKRSDVPGVGLIPYFNDAPIMVDCIDFAEWLKANTSREDRVILKLDIEGAEYRVLDHLLRSRATANIVRLYVEFHGHKIGLPHWQHRQLVRRLRAAGLPPRPWL